MAHQTTVESSQHRDQGLLSHTYDSLLHVPSQPSLILQYMHACFFKFVRVHIFNHVHMCLFCVHACMYLYDCICMTVSV